MSITWWIIVIVILAIIFVPIKLRILKNMMNKRKEREEENKEDF